MAPYAFERHEGAATVDQDGTVTLERVFRLFTGNAASRPAWSIATIGIAKYDRHPDDLTCRAISVSSTPVPDELGWFDVRYSYNNKTMDQGATNTTGGDGGTGPGSQDPTVQPNPTLRTPVVSWSANTRTIPFTRDWDPDGRKPVQNSAGQPFEGLEVEQITSLIKISFALTTSVDVATKQLTYVNKTNDNDFAIIPRYGPYLSNQLRCNAWNGTLQHEESYGWYTQCEVEFEFMPGEGWIKEILDAGYYKQVGLGGGLYTIRKIIDIQTGLPPDAPVKLNGAGSPVTDNSSHYLIFYPYQQVSFTNIML